jgi:hypothetical protein
MLLASNMTWVNDLNCKRNETTGFIYQSICYLSQDTLVTKIWQLRTTKVQISGAPPRWVRVWNIHEQTSNNFFSGGLVLGSPVSKLEKEQDWTRPSLCGRRSVVTCMTGSTWSSSVVIKIRHHMENSKGWPIIG